MKKTIALLLVIAVLMFSLVGCSSNPTLTGITSEDAITLAVGESNPLILNFLFDGDASAEAEQMAIEGLEVKYTSDNPDIASITGENITANAKGIAIITASVGEISTQTTVTVVVPLEDIDVGESTVQLTEDSEYTIPVAPVPINADLQGITYKSSDESVISVDTWGKVQAVGAGTANITITCGEKAKTVNFEVAPKIESINLESTEGLLYVNYTHQLTPSITPAEIEVDYTFTSSDEAIATVSETGLITAKTAGSCVITVSVNDVDISIDYTLTVTNPPAPRPSAGGSGGTGTGGAGAEQPAGEAPAGGGGEAPAPDPAPAPEQPSDPHANCIPGQTCLIDPTSWHYSGEAPDNFNEVPDLFWD